MVELKFGLRTVDLPYTIRIPDVTEKMFDELVDEDTRAELIDGVMIVHSPASMRHDDTSGFWRTLMRMYAARKRLGKVLGPDSLIHLGRRRKFPPDLFFLKKGRVKGVLPKLFKGTPDWVGEVLSPSNRDEDLEEKRLAFWEARVPELWFVDLDNEEVIVDRLVKDEYVTTKVSRGRISSTVVTGFWLEAAWLWSQPLPDEWDCLRKILKKEK
jgi:Uma2 family endonuclease